MDPLSQSLRAAVDEIPPSRIDLDRLIRTEQRARSRRRAGWALAGTAGTLLAGVTGMALLRPVISPQLPQSGPDPCAAVRPTPSTSEDAQFDDIPPGTAPQPTESEAAAVPRLSAALTAALATHLPDRTATDRIHPGCHWIQVEPNIYPARYYAQADIAGGAAGPGAFIIIMITEKDYPAVVGDDTEGAAYAYPEIETLPDGTVVGHFGAAGQTGARRSDGTTVTVIPHGEGEVATLEELIALATDPGLTLYP